jgi:hypothetical protein
MSKKKSHLCLCKRIPVGRHLYVSPLNLVTTCCHQNTNMLICHVVQMMRIRLHQIRYQVRCIPVSPRPYLIGLYRHTSVHLHTQPKTSVSVQKIQKQQNTKTRWWWTHGWDGSKHSSKTKYTMYGTGMLVHVIAVLGAQYCSSTLPIKYTIGHTGLTGKRESTAGFIAVLMLRLVCPQDI